MIFCRSGASTFNKDVAKAVFKLVATFSLFFLEVVHRTKEMCLFGFILSC